MEESSKVFWQAKYNKEEKLILAILIKARINRSLIGIGMNPKPF